MPEHILFFVQCPRNERTYHKLCPFDRPHILEATKSISVNFDIIYSILTGFMALHPTTLAFLTNSSLTICVIPIIGIPKVNKALKLFLSTPLRHVLEQRYSTTHSCPRK
jgi:hypothetical protein